MNSRDAGAEAESPKRSQRRARDLLFGRRYGLHRFIVLCLVAVIIYAVVASRSSALAGLPGVVRADGMKHEVELSSEIKADQAREVYRRALGLDEIWTLLLGSARLTTRVGLDGKASDDHAADVLHSLGTARLTEPAMIIIDASGPSIDVDLDQSNRVIPYVRSLITELSADEVLEVERLDINGSPSVTIARVALQQPAEVDAVLALLERVPRLSAAVLGEVLKAHVSSSDEAGAKRACEAARQALGERTDIELSVEFSSDSEREPDPETEFESQPC